MSQPQQAPVTQPPTAPPPPIECEVYLESLGARGYQPGHACPICKQPAELHRVQKASLSDRLTQLELKVENLHKGVNMLLDTLSMLQVSQRLVHRN